MEELRISQTAEHTAVLGPGDRAVIWVHGCCFQCPGCLAHEYKAGAYRSIRPEQAAAWFLATGADGLTVSGGEPMLQAQALVETVGLIRRSRQIHVIVYTGFLYEELQKKAAAEPAIARLLEQTDLLIDGPYRRELDTGRPYIGSDNQRLIYLTDRCRAEAEAYYAPKKGRKIEIKATPTGTVMIGVPDEGQRTIWNQIKAIGEKSNAD